MSCTPLAFSVSSQASQCFGRINTRSLLSSPRATARPLPPSPRPRGENVVDLMDALKKSIAGEASPAKGKKPRKAAAGQKEMLLPIEGKGRAQKKAAKSERATGLRKAG